MHRLAAVVAWALATGPAAAAPERYDFDRTPGRLAKTVVPSHYALEFELDPARDRFDASARIALKLRSAQPSLRLHARGLMPLRATLQGPRGAALPLQVQAEPATEMWRLVPPRALPPGDYTLAIRYRGRVQTHDIGLYRSGSGADAMLATQLQAISARRLFPGFDEPAFRARYEIAVRAPRGLEVVSNMPERSRSDAGEAATWHRFETTPPMPSYLVALAVGRFDSLEGSAAGVPLRVLTAPGRREQGQFALAATQQLLPWYSRYFGLPYALPKLDQLAVPSVRTGAMEDWGLISYAEELLLIDPARDGPEPQRAAYDTIAHELAHQWFGNLVTAASWNEIWLNEAFATWLAAKGSAHFNPDWNLPLSRRAALEESLERDAGSATRAIRAGPVAESRVAEVFDSITYDKGGAVLTMLEQWLGEGVFQRGLAAYIAGQQGSNATAGDLWHYLSQASGRDVDALARSWTDQPGHPRVQVETACIGGRTRVTLRQQRHATGAAARGARAWLWQVPVQVSRGDQQQTLLLDAPERRYELDGCRAEPLVANAGGAGYYRVEYDSAALQALTRRYAELAPADRIALASDTYALARAGRLTLRAWFDLLAAIPRVRDAGRASLYVHAAQGLRELARATAGTPAREHVLLAARALLAPELERIGWQPEPAEDSETQRLRGELIEALAGFDDAEAIRHAGELYELDRTGMQPLDASVRAAVLYAAGRGADRARFERLRGALLATVSGSERWVLAKALAAGRDAGRARELLALAASPALPDMAAVYLPLLVARHSEFGALAYDYTVRNWPALAERAGGAASVLRAWLLPGSAESFHDAADARRLRADQRRLAGPAGAVQAEEVAEAIELRAALRRREAAGLAAQLVGWEPRLGG